MKINLGLRYEVIQFYVKFGRLSYFLCVDILFGRYIKQIVSERGKFICKKRVKFKALTIIFRADEKSYFTGICFSANTINSGFFAHFAWWKTRL